MSAPTAAITVIMAMVATETMEVGIMVLEITTVHAEVQLHGVVQMVVTLAGIADL